MRTLLLLRHAAASPVEPPLDDHERPLTAAGRRAAASMGLRLARAGLRPGAILCSTALRAQQTYAGLAAALRRDVPVRFDSQLYLANLAGLVDRVARAPPGSGTLMIIGHNPGLQQLAVWLTENGLGGQAPWSGTLPPCGLAIVALEDEGSVRPGGGRLSSLLTPKDLGARA